MGRIIGVRADVEDSYLSDELVSILARCHGLRSEWLARHLLIDRLECDVVIFGLTRGYVVRTIGVELKQNDVHKLAEQAIKRRKLFHYMYIVIGEHWNTDMTIRTLHRYGYLSRLLSEGVGIITHEFGSPFIAVRSRFNPQPTYRPSKPIIEYLRCE